MWPRGQHNETETAGIENKDLSPEKKNGDF